MEEASGLLASLGTQLLQKQGEPEQTMCLSLLLPPLLGVAALGARALMRRWRARQSGAGLSGPSDVV